MSLLSSKAPWVDIHYTPKSAVRHTNVALIQENPEAKDAGKMEITEVSMYTTI